MLDAAHGEAPCAIVSMQGIRIVGLKVQASDVVTVGRMRRRSPPIAMRADKVDGSRRTVAEARSRHRKQSLG